jgi:hypothetical protein
MKRKSRPKEEKVDRNHPAFNKNAEPFYQIVMQGLKGEVDGEHFWDAVAEDAVFDFLYIIPGFTSQIVGRQAYMDWFGGYTNILHSAGDVELVGIFLVVRVAGGLGKCRLGSKEIPRHSLNGGHINKRMRR